MWLRGMKISALGDEIDLKNLTDILATDWKSGEKSKVLHTTSERRP